METRKLYKWKKCIASVLCIALLVGVVFLVKSIINSKRMGIQQDPTPDVTVTVAPQYQYDGTESNIDANGVSGDIDPYEKERELAKEIEAQLPEDVWGGYTIEPDRDKIVIYVFLLKDYDDVPEYDGVTYRRVKYSTDELREFYDILIEKKKEAGFYRLYYNYLENKVVVTFLEDSILDTDLLKKLVPEDAYMTEIIEKGMSLDTYAEIKQKIDDAVKDVEGLCESEDSRNIRVYFDADWISKAGFEENNYSPTMSLENYKIIVKVVRILLDYVDEINVTLRVEAGDKTETNGWREIYLSRDTEQLRTDRVRYVRPRNEDSSLDEKKINELFNEYVAGIHAESQLLIQGQEVDIDMECDDKTIEYFEFERFYELFGYGLSKEGIDADLIITVRDTRGETLYYVFYPTIYGGYRWVWINPIVAK